MTESEWLASIDPQAMLEFLFHGQRVDPNVSGHWKGRGDRSDPSDRKLRLFAVGCARGRHPDGFWEGYERQASARTVYDAAERMADDDHLFSDPDDYGAVERMAGAVAAHAHCNGLAVLIESSGEHAASAWAGYVAMDKDRSAYAALLRCIVGNPFRPVRLAVGPGEVFTYDFPADRPLVMTYEDVSWITPTVLSLASAAYEDRPGRECPADWWSVDSPGGISHPKECECHGTGRIEDGTLDPVTLLALADALEEEGCTEDALLRHLRGYRPCWACRGDFTEPPERHSGALTGLCVECLDDHGWERSPGLHARGCWAVDLCLGKE